MRKRIVHIINDINRGGAETLLLTICRGLNKKLKEFECCVFILHDKRYLEPEFLKAGIEIIYLDLIKNSPFKNVWKIYKKLKEYKPTIVHTHLLIADRYGQTAAFLAGIQRRVCSVHNMEVHRGKKDRLTRLITSLFATKIIAVSDSVKEFCIQNNMYPARKMVRIYNAPGFSAENSIPKELPRNKKNIRLVSIGRLAEQKGHIYLLQAMKELQTCPIRMDLAIYGEGDQEMSLKSEAEKLQVTNIFFKGVVSHIDTVLKNADLFIAPSLWEGFNMAVVEAMSVGVPVIVTDIPPHRELLGYRSDYPLYIAPASSRDIVDAVTMILKSPDMYAALSEEMIVYARQFTIQQMIDNYYTFYRSLF